MNPNDITPEAMIAAAALAKFDQAGASMNAIAQILASMALPLKEFGLSPVEAVQVALELLQTMLANAESHGGG